MTLAHSCLGSKQYQCVLNVHEQIVALKGESAEADMLAGEALDAMGDSGWREKELRAAVQIESDAAECALWARLSLMETETMVRSGHGVPVGT